MYIIACLIIVQLYSTRHPDLAAKPHIVFGIFAVIILVAVSGVVRLLHVFMHANVMYLTWWLVPACMQCAVVSLEFRHIIPCEKSSFSLTLSNTACMFSSGTLAAWFPPVVTLDQ